MEMRVKIKNPHDRRRRDKRGLRGNDNGVDFTDASYVVACYECIFEVSTDK